MRSSRSDERLRLLSAILACTWPFAACGAPPPLVAAPHLETFAGFRPLQFRNGKWVVRGEETDDSVVEVVASNPRVYATIEAYGEDLASPVTLRFQDGQSGQILDTVKMAAGTSAAVLRTIPLVARRILVQLVGGASLARAKSPSPACLFRSLRPVFRTA